MIVNEPRANERINVSVDELKEINKVVTGSAEKWRSGPNYIVDLFRASSNPRRKVFLRSEGWHQKERWNGEFYKHITVHLAGWTYHMYTKVTSDIEPITATENRIDYISYDAGRGRFVNLSP